jgi:hypothetical protein
MVVPASGVIPGRDNSSALPFLQSLEAIDKIDEEGLLDQGIRIARVAILMGRGLDKTDRRKIVSRDSVSEVCDVVLMVRLIAHVADQCDGGWGEVLRIRSGRVILKGLGDAECSRCVSRRSAEDETKCNLGSPPGTSPSYSCGSSIQTPKQPVRLENFFAGACSRDRRPERVSTMRLSRTLSSRSLWPL